MVENFLSSSITTIYSYGGKEYQSYTSQDIAFAKCRHLHILFYFMFESQDLIYYRR